MAIKRYIADADTTITNAYKENLSDRATGANMGASDSMEVFSIWAQRSSSVDGPSLETSRTLVKFPVTSISADRTSGTLPVSGSVNFYLKLTNAVHPNTLPSDYKLAVFPVSQSWSEGYGLDMELYKDLGEASWNSRLTAAVAATATITVLSTAGEGDLDTKTFALTGSSGTIQEFTFDGDVTTTVNGAIGIDDENVAAMAKSIVDAINDASVTIGVTASPTTPVAVAGNYPITLTQDTAGTSGNKTITGVDLADIITYDAAFAGGAATTSWGTAGGTYHTESATLLAADSATHADNLRVNYTVSFADGDEDLEIDISELVEQWLDSRKTNYGIGIQMSGTYEDGTLSASFYTKKFFTRTSEFFFKRPRIEARWNAAKKDDRANFYASSSMVPGADNLNKLWLYNWTRGQLKNIPGLDSSNTLTLKLYRDSLTDAEPITATAYICGLPGAVGIYTASLAADTTASLLYDVWSTGSTEYHTGSAITVKNFKPLAESPNPVYVTSMTSLRPSYSRKETARFRLFVREKNWSPTIYAKATQTLDSSIIDSGYYKIFRVSDDTEVIPYGTGSTAHTQLSYDQSGSYFDLDMGLLEAGFAYGLNFAYYLSGKYVEQSEVFKFRVEE